VRDEDRDMQIYRLICECETGITSDEICSICQKQFFPPDQTQEREFILESLSRLKTYLLIDEHCGCYTAVSITEYMLKSQLKHMKPRISEDYPEIEIVNGVIRVKSTDDVQK